MQASEAAPQTAAVIAFPVNPETRLRVALRNLDAALAEQRQAVAAFRKELAALGGAVSQLEDSAVELRERLSDAAAETERAREASAQLMRTANEMQRYC
jgi:chromosome segregation ATPase